MRQTLPKLLLCGILSQKQEKQCSLHHHNSRYKNTDIKCVALEKLPGKVHIWYLNLALSDKKHTFLLLLTLERLLLDHSITYTDLELIHSAEQSQGCVYIAKEQLCVRHLEFAEVSEVSGS